MTAPTPGCSHPPDDEGSRSCLLSQLSVKELIITKMSFSLNQRGTFFLLKLRRIKPSTPSGSPQPLRQLVGVGAGQALHSQPNV